MAPDRKSRWKKEVDWLLSVTDYIVEFVPSQQKAKDGTTMEVESISDMPLSSFSDITLARVGLNLLSSLSTDNDHTTEKRPAHEHPSIAQARHNAYCKKPISLSYPPKYY